ncbi:MAG: hypothetical protein PHP79_11720, partial [Clostridia bacterium]|nr:hypothetical protein [Clostridia bacterium]
MTVKIFYYGKNKIFRLSDYLYFFGLAFGINAIIDESKFIPFNEMIKHIEKRTVWDLLETQGGEAMCLNM